MKKSVFYTELAYVFGMLFLAFGAALMTVSDFGVSMIVAPAYIIHLKVSEFVPFFSFGMAEYTIQALLLVVMMIVVRKVKLSYFFSIVTAIMYGIILDISLAVVSLFPESIVFRVIFYVSGLFLTSLGVAMFFHTYIAPEVYELFVKEVSSRYNLNINKVKIIYDCGSCLVSIVLSFAMFGLWNFEGINWGTIVCALVNGILISGWTRILEAKFEFKDRLNIEFLK